MSLRDQLLTADTPSEIADVIDAYVGTNLARFSLSQTGEVEGLVGPAGTIPIGGTQCEAFGASPSATAAVNTAAIQAALNIGGLVSLTKPGVYLNNHQFTFYDNTRFYIGPGVILRQAPGTSKKFAVNENWLATEITASGNITVANKAASNRYQVATIPLTAAATYAVGSFIQVKGDTTESFNGVHEVFAVNQSGNNVQFLIPGVTTWPTSAGTIKVAAANANIDIVVDGRLDWDEPNNSAAADLNRMGIIFNRVGNVKISGNFYGVDKYVVLLSNSINVIVSDMYCVTGSDGVHLNGPNSKIIIRNVGGIFGDDIVAWTGSDTGYAAYALQDGQGPLNGLLVDGCFAHATISRGILIAPSSANSAEGRNIVLRNINISKTVGGAVLIDSPTAESGVVHDVTIDGVSMGNIGSGEPQTVIVGSTTATTVHSLRVININNPALGRLPGHLCLVGNGSVVGQMTLENIDVTMPTEAAASRFLVYLYNSGTVTRLDCNNVNTKAQGSTRSYSWVNSDGTAVTLTDMNVTGGSCDGHGNIATVIWTGTPVIRITGLRFSGQFVVGGSYGFIAHVSGMYATAAGGGVLFSCYGTSKAYTFYLYGNAAPGLTMFGYGTTNTFNLKGSDATTVMKTDTAGHTFTITPGAMLYDTQTAVPGVYVKGSTTYTRIAA